MTMPICASPVPSSPPLSAPASSNGARLVTPEGRCLPLERTSLECRAGGGLARSVLRQRFVNDGAEPLEVTYLLPLPNDGAVSGYQLTVRGEVSRGQVAPNQISRELYEQALLEGKSAALLEQDRSSVFRQAVGNVPPGERVEIEVSVDHPLRWLDGGWELRFPTVVAPRYQASEEPSATVPVLVEREGVAEPAHEARFEIHDALTGAVSSPSHSLEGDATSLRVVHARLDRDVVVRWPVAAPEVGARLETARPAGKRAQYGVLTLVPPRTPTSTVPRDLIVLLDTSGSMAGEPLAQAVRVVSALVQSLTATDSLELIEFGSKPRRWRPEATPVTPQAQRAALSWLAALSAGGGTEMRSGIEAALGSLRDGALRQVILVSDGLIGFERQVLQQLLRRLPESCRFHTVGVGHATNGSLLQPAARAGRGACVVVAPGEDVEPACARLLARTAQPLVVNLRVSGGALREPPTRALDLYAGAPVLLPLALTTEGGTLRLAGETADGAFVRELVVEPRDAGTGDVRLAALYARERVEDLELQFAAGESEPSFIEREIEKLGVEFQIASRLTSWVAVSDTAQVDPGSPTRRVEQPQLLPAGMSAEGLGLRSNLTPVMAGAPRRMVMPSPSFGSALPPPTRARAAEPPAPAAPVRKSAGIVGRIFEIFAPVAGAGASGAAEEDGAPSGARQLRGVVRSHTDSRLVISVTVADELDWQPPTSVSLVLADGTTVSLTLDPKLTTRASNLGVGQDLRLVFRLPSPLVAPRSLTVVSGDVTLEVSLGG